MSYIDYINKFWRANEHFQFSVSAIGVYFYLLNACNKRHWEMPFPCSSVIICDSLQISKQTLSNIIQQLVDVGLISVNKGKSRYTHPLFTILDWSVDWTVKQTKNLTDNQMDDLAHNKRNKNKDNIDSSLSSESPSSDEPMTVGDDERNSGGVGFNNREEGSSLEDTEKVKIRKQERCGNDSLDNRGGSSSDKEINLPAFIEFFNRTLKEHHSVIPPIVKISGQRKERLLARVKEYSKEALMKAVINAATAPFLNGASDKPFVASLDWIVRPNNFPKVLEGNYNHQVNNLNSQPYGTSSSNNGYRTAEDLRQGAATIISRRAAASQQPDEELPVV